MAISLPRNEDIPVTFSWTELTGAIGDSITVLPIIIAVGALTDLSLAVMLVWFGLFQIIWGLYYGVPVSVEPMKVLGALLITGSITVGEATVAGLLLGGILLGVGNTGTLARISQYIGTPVIRGIQLGVGLLLLETGIQLAGGQPLLAGLAVLFVVGAYLSGRWRVSVLAVLLVGSVLAIARVGIPTPHLVTLGPVRPVGALFESITMTTLTASLAQLAMTLGNAALATAVLLGDYFDRGISADSLATSMGLMNLLAVPLGGHPMCHGSGGVAGKYAFGARTAGANVLLGIGYVVVALVAVSIVAAFPVAILGVLVAIIAIQLSKTSLSRTSRYPIVLLVGACGLVFNLGIAFLLGLIGDRVWDQLTSSASSQS